MAGLGACWAGPGSAERQPTVPLTVNTSTIPRTIPGAPNLASLFTPCFLSTGIASMGVQATGFLVLSDVEGSCAEPGRKKSGALAPEVVILLCPSIDTVLPAAGRGGPAGGSRTASPTRPARLPRSS